VRAPLLVFAVALAARLLLGLWLLHAGSYVLASDDGDAYVAAARHAAFGEPIVVTDRLAGKWRYQPNQDPGSRWPPAYWLFLAAQYRTFGDQHISTVVVQALAGAVAALATLKLAARVLANRWALTAALLVAVPSTLVYLSAAIYAEAVYIPLLLVALELSLRKTPTSALLAGLALGLAEATRPVALAVLPVLACATGKRTLLQLVAGFALALSPFVARDLLALGSPALFTAGADAALHDSLTQAPSALQRLSTMFLTGGWAPIGDPYATPTPASATLIRGAFVLLAVAGAVYLGINTSASRTLLLAVLAMTLPPLILGLPLVRYRAPADPLLLIWFTAGVQAVTLKWHHFRPQEAPDGRIQGRARDPVLR